jgi:hypothetical protein
MVIVEGNVCILGRNDRWGPWGHNSELHVPRKYIEFYGQRIIIWDTRSTMSSHYNIF